MTRNYILAIAGTAGLAAWLLVPGQTVHSQPAAALDDTTAAIRVEFGLTDKEPSPWEGTVSAVGGEVASVRNWHPRPGDSLQGNSFKLATRQGVNFVKRPWELPYPVPQRPYLTTPGVVVDVRGAAAKVRVSTQVGAFEVEPFALELGRTRRFLDGRVVVERVPVVQAVSSEDREGDFSSILTHPASGEVWTAWVSYKDGKNELLARRFDGRAWGQTRKISTDHTDIHLPRMARDKAGNVWFFWSAQVDGNWDLYARRTEGSIVRLTEDAQADIYPAATTDANGNVWVVWQGFRNGKSDIFARRYDGSAWSAAEKVSASAANDWIPAIAADSKGRVHVGWDSYGAGNYDIEVRTFSGGAWGAVTSVAGTPRFEAYLSLACDKDDRLWALWNEAGFEWGKDTGFIPKQEGTPLYRDRWMNIAVLDGGVWKTTAADLQKSLPEGLRSHNDLPQLQPDAAGRMWVFFRHRSLRIRDLPADTPAHRAAWEIYGTSYDGERWSAPVALPFSASRQDVRTGFGIGPGHTLYAAYPTDHRDFEDFLYRRSQVNVARVPLGGGFVAAPRLGERESGKLTTPVGHADEPKDLARIRGEAWALNGKTYKIYRGDTHRHTEISMDGNNDGSLIDAYRYAIDAASLDYLLTSEHNGLSGPDQDYINWLLNQTVDLFTIPGTFVPLYGYERSVGYPNGHRNVMFAKRGVPTLPIPVEEQKARTGAAKLYEYLKQYGGVAISHTSASTMGTDWRDNDPEVEPLVEIYQGDRVSAEYEGAPKAAYTSNPASQIGGFRPAGYVWNAWAKGYKLGIQAASDHLSTHISYACTIATEFTRQGLIDAMKLRHSYGATDNIVLDYRLENAGKQYLQGEIVPVKGRHELVVNVKGTRPIRQIDIVRDNTFVHTRHPMALEVSFRFADLEKLAPAAPGKETYYYVRVQQVDDQIAWSSPIWIKR